MHVTALQFDIVWESPAENFATVEAMLGESPPPPGGIVVLPELFATGFSMNTAATMLAELPTHEFLTRIAKRYQTSILAGVAMTSDGAPRNMAVLVGPDGDVEFTYAKRNPFPPAGEPEVYAAGTQPGIFECCGKKCCVAICYDLRFDEIYNMAAAADVEMIFVIASFPAVRRDDWIRLLAERARQTRAHVIGCNRIGRDPNEAYAGDSVILDPAGQPLAEAGDRQTAIGAN
ncbi:MAG: carbon-nitrogen family hydrolase, partial [Phycisphaerales bacterium]|nr:carbon-nitrogen family hydrolase [Phycisphaerales bacterium]